MPIDMSFVREMHEMTWFQCITGNERGRPIAWRIVRRRREARVAEKNGWDRRMRKKHRHISEYFAIKKLVFLERLEIAHYRNM